MKQKPTRLRLILGDQLNINHSWFANPDPDVVYVIAEMRQETDYTTHHVQKICAFFLSMRAFADELESSGHHVMYLTLDETRKDTDLPTLINRLIRENNFERFEYIEPDEYRVDHQMRALDNKLSIPVECVDGEHFLVSRQHLGEYFDTSKRLVMETFYRRMRRETGLLMEGDKPVGGSWNYDKLNRKKLPKNIDIPPPLDFEHDASIIRDLLDKHEVRTIGAMDNAIIAWPITRHESLSLLNHFVDECLPRFGLYQDAMTDRGWSLFHSRLSFSLNTKMLHPLEVVGAAISAWNRREDIDIAQVEGFVRQIIGWREFMRGIYWSFMPDYESRNTLDHERALPAFYWSGDTRMNCMRVAINQSLEHAYAHHIQRLMVTGNFALLAGIDPDEVDDWYLGIYIDALQWVELPNTRGMSQFADDGVVATKPYVSSGKYIQRMSDHCSGCDYDVSKRSGEGACPFNVLYWHFLQRHRSRFESNHRMRMMYANLDRIPARELDEINTLASAYLEKIDKL